MPTIRTNVVIPGLCAITKQLCIDAILERRLWYGEICEFYISNGYEKDVFAALDTNQTAHNPGPAIIISADEIVCGILAHGFATTPKFKPVSIVPLGDPSFVDKVIEFIESYQYCEI